MDGLTIATAFKMTVALGVVLVTFGAAIWVAKKFTAGKVSGFLARGNKPNVRPLEILAFQSLGPGKNVYILRCYNKKVLVGATSTNIHHISDIQEDSEEALEESDNNFQARLEENSSDSAEQNTKRRFGSFLRDLSRV